jgi:regulation of enolase protein 1 (concanavalin A-like superfamily)
MTPKKGIGHFWVICAALVVLAGAAPAPKAAVEIKGFGAVVDPDRDCTFNLEDGRLKIAIPTATHSLTISLEKQNAPRVLRDLEGDFTAVVRVEAEFPDNPMSDIKDSEPAVAAGLVVWADDETYACFERAHEVLGGAKHTSTEVHYIDAGQDGGESGPPVRYDGKPAYLRVTRSGIKVSGEVSTDGTDWKAAGLVELKNLPAKVKVGVFAEHNTGKKVTATFDKFEVKPAGAEKK